MSLQTGRACLIIPCKIQANAARPSQLSYKTVTLLYLQHGARTTLQPPTNAWKHV